MRMNYLGDSYDIVKQSMLRWLSSFGEWSVHPMFTEPVSHSDVVAFESLLDAKVVSTEILEVGTNRSAYLECGCSCGHLFLDTDTGLKMQPIRNAHAPQYIFATELEHLAEQRPHSLTLVFDQCVGRGAERIHLEKKLRGLRDRGLFGFAYVSHACFVVAGRDRRIVEQARTRVIGESRLPEQRLLPVPPA